MGAAVVEWVAKRTNEFGNFGAAQGIGWAKPVSSYRLLDSNSILPQDNLCAGVAYCEWNGVNVVCHIASDGSKRWLTREFLGTIFDYPFNQLKAKRITVCVGEGNSASRKFVEHLGFILEAELAGAHPTGAIRIYRMWREECRFLRMRNGLRLAA